MQRSRAESSTNGGRGPEVGGEGPDGGTQTERRAPGAHAEDGQSLGIGGAAAAPDLERGTVLRLLVRNHPGVMSHVCGLFARRAFNVEGIVCVPVDDGTRSVILLVVVEDARLEQVVRQIEKLEDVLDVRRAPEAREAIAAVARWLH